MLKLLHWKITTWRRDDKGQASVNPLPPPFVGSFFIVSGIRWDHFCQKHIFIYTQDDGTNVQSTMSEGKGAFIKATQLLTT